MQWLFFTLKLYIFVSRSLNLAKNVFLAKMFYYSWFLAPDLSTTKSMLPAERRISALAHSNSHWKPYWSSLELFKLMFTMLQLLKHILRSFHSIAKVLHGCIPDLKRYFNRGSRREGILAWSWGEFWAGKFGFEAIYLGNFQRKREKNLYHQFSHWRESKLANG